MSGHPSLLYYLALLAWPIFIFVIAKKFEIEKVIIISFFVAYLALPVKPSSSDPLAVPILGALTKENIPMLTLLVLIFTKKLKLIKRPSGLIGTALTVGFFSFPFLTIFNNTEPLIFGPRLIPGLTIKDAIFELTINCLEIWLPFILGLTFLRSDKSHEQLLKIMCVLGLIYTIPMLWEVRMSPQLHTQIYGFFPHSFGQQRRAGGFRPVVFLGHGLLVAVFCAMTLMSAFYLWRQKHPVLKNKGFWVVCYLSVVLVLCKTYSAIIYILIFAAIIMLSRSIQTRMRLACILATLILLFPAIRHNFPLADVVEFTASINEERSRSLKFRFDNEDQLIDRALEKPVFGWGTWGRDRIYDVYSGNDLSVTDGAWIIIFGRFGWYGYITLMGLMIFPIFAIYSASKRKNNGEVTDYSVALALILAIILVDQIPNASIKNFLFLIAGALMGRAQELRLTKSTKVAVSAGSARKPRVNSMETEKQN